MNCLPFLMSKKWEAVHYMVELILKGSGLLRTAAHDPRHALRAFYCSLFAIAWSISLSSAARCSAELMAPTIGFPTMLPF